MSGKRMPGRLIGVCLLKDSYIPKQRILNANILSDGIVIGSINIQSDATCAQLRRALNNHAWAPKDFRFFNFHGWPIDSLTESVLPVTDCLITDVVLIQIKHKELSRVGIKLLSGYVVGFIFLSYNFEISDVRKTICEELKDEFESDETFEFIENNEWPVRRSQEANISVWDLVVDNCITIAKRRVQNEDGMEGKNKKRKLVDKSCDTSDIDKVSLDQPSFLISYVHQEATSYAQELKKELTKLGYTNIFLDIDDISAGQDWQDVITLAVNKCTVFIPLVTPRYGETRWTNREAKLADDRGKIIIPISFLDKWPPDQLAIQFVTLQYIPWKTSEEIQEANFCGDLKSAWNPESVQRVANEIKRLYPEEETSSSSSSSRSNNVRKLPKQFTMNWNLPRRRVKTNSFSSSIIISAHSKQEDFVKKIEEMITSDGYSVWNSLNLCRECDEENFSPIEDTQPFMPPPATDSKGIITPPVHFGSAKTFSFFSGDVQALKKEFKSKVKESKIVVLVFSEDYLNSSICRQQAFYCEQRKKSIVIKHGDFQIDNMILELYPEHEMIAIENWECLKFKIKEKLKFDSEDSYRNTIMLSVSKLRNVVNTDATVYVIGGTSEYSQGAESFCLVLGNELAKIKELNLATEGFSGIGNLLAKNFCEEQEIRNKKEKSRVFHILPISDTEDYRGKARQIKGRFQKLPYGNTLFYGMSVLNRNDIVAAAFKVCILIEGGERSACLAEKFLWNECTVIPVLFNNMAVKSKKCLLESIKKVPNGVKSSDWKRLNAKFCSPEKRALTVKRIVCALLHLESGEENVKKNIRKAQTKVETENGEESD